MDTTITVIVPVYNSENMLAALIERLQLVLEATASAYETLLVNDGSRDQSWTVIEELAARYSWVRGINLMRNYGQHNALLCGIRAARYECIVTLDDDLQNPPEELPRLVAKLQEGFDVVYGTPTKERHGLWRDLASQITKIALQAAMGAEIARKVSAFRVFRTQLRDAFTQYQSPLLSLDVLLTWGTTRFCAITVRHDARQTGRSGYTFRKLVVHALNMMTGFSTAPLKLANFLGFLFTLVGIGIFIYVVGRYFLQGTTVPGFPFLASIIALFSGTQLFVLGIMGEYLARMHTRALDRPTYVVRATTSKENKTLADTL